MTIAASTHAEPLVGREDQLGELHSFLGADSPWRALVVTGEAGIGKTAIWEAGISLARERGFRVLSARANEAETRLLFACVADLLDGVQPDELDAVPQPQSGALYAALRREGPTDAPLDALAIASAVLNAFRQLSSVQPLLVAIDDVPWVDDASADALAFAARRLGGPGVRFLFTRRRPPGSTLERAVGARSVRDLEIGPLSLGAINRALVDRLGTQLPRPLLRRVFETSNGNPLFALELGRTLVEQGVPEIGADLPLPDLIEDVFGARVTSLSPPVRQVLLAVALSPALTEAELAAVADPIAVEQAVAASLLVHDGQHVRISHPLLAAVVRHRSNPRERREMHRALAAAVTDTTLRARHLAMAAVSPDGQLASTIAAAATEASRRGAIHEAIELGQDALRLTPPDSPDHSERVLALATYFQTSADPGRAHKLLNAHLDGLPRGRARARAYLLLGEAAGGDADLRNFERALDESRDEPDLHAIAMAKISLLLGISRIKHIDLADAMASEALASVRGFDEEVEKQVLVAAAWMGTLRGRSIDELVNRFPRSAAARGMFDSALERPAGVRHAFRGEITRARATFERLVADADARGDAPLGAALQLQLCELALRGGDVAAASGLLDEVVSRTIEHRHQLRFTEARLRALVAAVTGQPDAARRFAKEVFASTAPSQREAWDRLEALRAAGIADVFSHDAAEAVTRLRTVWDHTVHEAVDDPGAFPVAGELVEALVEAGDLDGARSVTDRLAQLSVQQDHPWGLATVRRCSAVLTLADHYDEAAAMEMIESTQAYGRLGMRFDRARTLLFLGRVQRRFKKRGDARRTLESAAAEFEACGSTGWAEQARAELARISGRRLSPETVLTQSEHRVASLAATGISNKEIAARLFVTVHTVEAHLSSSYEKLGVRSRAQLAQRLATIA